MKETTKYIVYTLKNKASVVMFGKKKIDDTFFTKEMFLERLENKYTFTSSKIEKFKDKLGADAIYLHKMKHYMYAHNGAKPLYNQPTETKKKAPPKPKNKSVAEKNIVKKNIDKTLKIISKLTYDEYVNNIEGIFHIGYQLGYKHAKAGKKRHLSQNLSQISVDVGSKK